MRILILMILSIVAVVAYWFICAILAVIYSILIDCDYKSTGALIRAAPFIPIMLWVLWKKGGEENPFKTRWGFWKAVIWLTLPVVVTGFSWAAHATGRVDLAWWLFTFRGVSVLVLPVVWMCFSLPAFFRDDCPRCY